MRHNHRPYRVRRYCKHRLLQGILQDRAVEARLRGTVRESGAVDILRRVETVIRHAPNGDHYRKNRQQRPL